MKVSKELVKAYVEDTTTLIKEMDKLLKKRNSIGSLDEASIDVLFRTFHTIKASASAMDDKKTVDVSYKIENVVSYLRKHGPDSLPAKDVIDLMFNSEYYYRTRLNSYMQEIAEDEGTSKFEGMLSTFMDEKSIEKQLPTSTMVPFHDFLPMCQNIIDSMSEDLHKKVELKFDGEDILIHRQYVSRLSSSIIQLVRNAVDHGIETPEERIRLGKPETGIITITYGIEDDLLFITIFNDGRTLNLKEILRKADNLHMLKKPRREYKAQEIANFIMERGFTTKDSLGKYSGRGVGMDIIKATVKDMGGTVIVNSGVESGFSITMTIPAEEYVEPANKEFHKDSQK